MESSYIGVVGGMGPDAGINLSKNIIYNTIATKDQDHISQILYSSPSGISDRTDFILGKVSENPGYQIARILINLHSIGVGIAGLACNSAHAPVIFDIITEEIKKSGIKLSLLHMIEETGYFIKTHYPSFKKIGILGTTGTFVSKQYDRLIKFGLNTINISASEQEKLHKAIYDPEYGVKSNPGNISDTSVSIVNSACNSLIQNGAEMIVLGCTELPVIFKGKYYKDIPVIDSSVALARALIKAHSPHKLKPWIN